MALVIVNSPRKQLGGLGQNIVSEVINSITQGATAIFATATGQKSAKEAQATQLELARLQTQRLIAEEQRLTAQTEARAQASSGVFQALPYVAGAGILLLVVAMVAKR